MLPHLNGDATAFGANVAMHSESFLFTDLRADCKMGRCGMGLCKKTPFRWRRARARALVTQTMQADKRLMASAQQRMNQRRKSL
eukprot:5155949-Amphidinium_carterae.3